MNESDIIRHSANVAYDFSSGAHLTLMANKANMEAEKISNDFYNKKYKEVLSSTEKPEV